MIIASRFISTLLILAATSAFCGEVATPAVVSKPATEIPRKTDVLSRLRNHFMLGLATSPNDSWIDETRKQGAPWDIRYMYFCGGVNTGNNWTTWNQPAGMYLTIFLNESEKLNTIPCVTYYQMLQSLPAHGTGSEPQVNRTNSDNPATMRAYFEDIKLVMQKCGEYRTKDGHAMPVIFHHEPDLWGFFFIAPEFAPHDPDKVHIAVKSSGMPDVSGFDDSIAGFGKAIVALRDKYAPNVILAAHVSRWGNIDAQKLANFYARCGNWDMFFADVSDRDSGWKLAHNYMAGGAWWKEKDFEDFRNWSAELHNITRMNMMLWQVPEGNTIMASCNNTENHYMDNRPEYFLENYPANSHIEEWAKAGWLGILFGGGAGGCTSRGDGAKDGITNPTPITGNKGEKASYADDDGGYLRLRGINYYKKPFVFGQKPVAKAAPKVEVPKVDESIVLAWQPKLILKINDSVKAGKKIPVSLAMGRDKENFTVAGADDKSLRVSIQNNPMDYAWKDVPLPVRLQVIKAALGGDDDVDGLLLAAVYAAVNGDRSVSEEFLAKASLKNSAAALALKSSLESAPPPAPLEK
jgi:hypothetical protein